MSYKKFLKIALVILIMAVLVLAGYFGWRWITKQAEVDDIFVGEVLPPAKTDSGIQVKEPGVDVVSSQRKQTLSVISDSPVFYFWTVPDTKSVYYISRDGKVLKTGDGEDQVVSSQGLDNILSAEAVNGGGKVLASFGDKLSQQWAIFDVIDGVWRPLPQEITQATWGKDGNEIVALRKNGSDVNLVSLNLAKNPISVSVVVKNFNFKDVALSWRPPNYLVIAEKSSANYSGRIWQMDLKSLAFKQIVSGEVGQILSLFPGYALGMKFVSPDNFSIVDYRLRDTGITTRITLPEKCAVSLIGIFCFVPKEIPSGVILPDDYLNKRFRSNDELYLIDQDYGDETLVVMDNTDFTPVLDGWRPVYLDNSIYFINRLDGLVYRLSLN